ncbi:transcription repressor ofp6 [Phtheirospermum japonicum]|uniref:Transcription repressor n=1 Tax=Phtheirospermum japonicum TaxID=374723 RepID=A0A830DI98_9LAMI|nr:transcription repressor ofp6 [Phtheirospermum japonicum]
MSSNKIRKLKSIFTASGGCGCGPKSTDIIEPIQKPKPPFPDQKPTRHRSSSSAAASDDDYTSTTFSLNIDASPAARCCPEHTKCSKTVSAAACPKIHDSLAVVKDSDDPYQDFRQSMLQMIFEKEIYSRNDLQQLLDCFLQLNSPPHHATIIRAFMEIWNGGVGGGDAAAPVLPVGSCVNPVGAAGGGHVKTLNSQVG